MAFEFFKFYILISFFFTQQFRNIYIICESA